MNFLYIITFILKFIRNSKHKSEFMTKSTQNLNSCSFDLQVLLKKLQLPPPDNPKKFTGVISMYLFKDYMYHS